MAKARLKIVAASERLRESLWLIPGLMVGAAAALATLLVRSTGPAPDIPLQELMLPATAESAFPVMQVVAGSVITVTSVVFSLTVIALQITAGNYSPRALRTFLRDLGTQIVLGTFLSTFAYSYIVLQNIESLSGGSARWAPQVAFLAVPAFVVASLIALVFFIHHVTQAIRVDLILKEVLDETLDTIDTVHPDQAQDHATHGKKPSVPKHATEVRSTDSGFVQSFGLTELLQEAASADVIAVFSPTVGDHVLEGSTLAWVWREGARDAVDDEIISAVLDAVQIGRERSIDQDVAYGMRQLVDIAVRAMSPGVNDPNTAIAAILHLAVVYRRLLTRDLGPISAADARGTIRITVPYPSLAEYLTIMVQQVGYYGRGDVMVVIRLLRELGKLKALAAPQDHEALDAAIDHVLREAEAGLDVETKLDLVRSAASDAKKQTSTFRHYTAGG